MELNIYTIKDLVAGEVGPLFSAVNDKVAVRQVCVLLHDVIDVADFSLLCLGTFDTETLIVKSAIREVDFLVDFYNYVNKIESKDKSREVEI